MGASMYGCANPGVGPVSVVGRCLARRKHDDNRPYWPHNGDDMTTLLLGIAMVVIVVLVIVVVLDDGGR